jgi:hypothetical protein
MLANLNKGHATAGQVLLDLQCYRKVVRKVQTVIRVDRKQPARVLRGGL